MLRQRPQDVDLNWQLLVRSLVDLHGHYSAQGLVLPGHHVGFGAGSYGMTSLMMVREVGSGVDWCSYISTKSLRLPLRELLIPDLVMVYVDMRDVWEMEAARHSG